MYSLNFLMHFFLSSILCVPTSVDELLLLSLCIEALSDDGHVQLKHVVTEKKNKKLHLRQKYMYIENKYITATGCLNAIFIFIQIYTF
jgi:hypothetical protein